MGLVPNPPIRRSSARPGGKQNNEIRKTSSASNPRVFKVAGEQVPSENSSGRDVPRGALRDQRSKPVATRALKSSGIVSGNIRRSRGL